MAIVNAVPRVLRNFNLYLLSTSWAGKCEDVTLPKIAMKKEEYRAGGMDIPDICDQGMEAMECSMNLLEYDEGIMQQYGVMTGSAPQDNADVKLRGAIANNDGTTHAVKIDMTGQWTSVEMGTWKAGENAKLALTMHVAKYTLIIDSKPIYLIDPLNMVRTINATDELALQKAAMAL
jgi:P2 family phage contractile tail tube protein